MRYLTTGDLLAIADLVMDGRADVRDAGMVDSAAQRPRATVFGQDAYPDLHTKAAALLHSVLRNHPLVDGNKRLAWVGCRTFLALNGADFTPDEDASVAFVVDVAGGGVRELDVIAAQLRAWTG